jgi:hypothetical protein
VHAFFELIDPGTEPGSVAVEVPCPRACYYRFERWPCNLIAF